MITFHFDIHTVSVHLSLERDKIIRINRTEKLPVNCALRGITGE